LLATAERDGARVVYGRREWIPPSPAPFWYVTPEINKHVDGEALRYAATHNVLMSS
jgi:hypothetical protein